MRSYTKDGPNHMSLKHKDYASIKHVWFDVPKTGEAILLHVGVIDSPTLRVLEKKEVIGFINELKDRGWVTEK